jgi:hypothetical protein
MFVYANCSLIKLFGNSSFQVRDETYSLRIFNSSPLLSPPHTLIEICPEIINEINEIK